MSRDLTQAELHALSEEMKKAGHLSYEEFCEELEKENGHEQNET